MDIHLDEELGKFNQNLIKMAALTEESIHKSIEALMKRDEKLGEAVFVNDREIDEFENQIEEEAIGLLALFQPMARDLRFIATGMHLNNELEKIADLAVNIAQRSREITESSPLKYDDRIPKLADNAKKMVRQAIDSFVKQDEDLAKEVIISDQISNKLRNQIMQSLNEDFIVKGGAPATEAVTVLLVVRDLERISDHAAAIAEEVVYMIKAKVVKHHLDEFIEPDKKKK